MSEFPDEVHRLTDDEIVVFVKEFRDGRWYKLDGEEDIKLCAFLPVMGVLRQAKKSWVDSVGDIFGDMTKTFPRSINGKPVFLGVEFIQKDDVPIIYDTHEASKPPETFEVVRDVVHSS